MVFNFGDLVSKQGFRGICRYVANDICEDELFQEIDTAPNFFLGQYVEKMLLALYISYKTDMPAEFSLKDPMTGILVKLKYMDSCEPDEKPRKADVDYFYTSFRLHDLFKAFV